MLKMLVKFPILKRLIPSILKALKIRDKKFKSDGINYLLDLRYLVDRRFYLFGWDDDIIDYLDKFIKDNKCKFFLDIGSCWGVYSLRIAKKNSNVNIISFDVFHKNIERLNAMKKDNNLENIKTYNVAIGAEKKIETFAVDEEFSPNYAKDNMGKYSISVNQDLIDNLVKLRNEKIAIKLDVERVELEALQGANQLLKNNRCFIIIETNKNKEGVFKYLKSLNFNQIKHNFDSEDYFFTNFL